MKNDKLDAMMEEIKPETDPIRKQMLLQKYGLMAPQLTEKEQTLCILQTLK
jgi:hypothetical protein